jgi:WD40 repeat protein
MHFDGFISYSHAADGRLAPALQRGLHRLAKPWHRRRALWIFRDQTGLSVTPALWSSIQQALDGSEWFVLLASPEAARSPWVNREIEHWIATKPADRILPVVTDGTWAWDAERRDLTADSTAVPDALRGAFDEEPLFLDLRWARDDRHLSLRHAGFREAVAQLAAPMHGISKDELEGEDVRQHRRGRRLSWVAASAVVVLTVVASLAGTLAGHNADRATASAAQARHQQQVAEQQRGNAERYAQLAQRQEENARTQQGRARAAAAETKRQEQRAREQHGVAERAAAEAARQQRQARRQQQLAKRAQTLAGEQEAIAREQRELAQHSTTESTRQRRIAEQQQRLAAEATVEAESQRQRARQQQRLAEEAAAEARRQEGIARENERKASAAAEDARRQEENAAAQGRIAVSRRLLNQAKATIDDDPVTALKLGIAAQKIQAGGEASRELAGLVAATRKVGVVGEVLYAAYGPGGVLAVVRPDYTAGLWSVADPARPVQLASLDGDLFTGQPAFSRDGRTLAIVGGESYQPLLFDVSDPVHPVLAGSVPLGSSLSLSLSPDGTTLAELTGNDWTLWDVADRGHPVLLAEIAEERRSSNPIAFSHDGRTLVTPGEPATVWDVTDRRHPQVVSTLDGDWGKMAFSPARPQLAGIDIDGELAVWQMDDRSQPRRSATRPGDGYSVSFSPDGFTLVSSDTDGTARLWDVTDDTAVRMAEFNDRSGGADSIGFSPDGRTLVTVGYLGTLSLWTVQTHGEPTALGRVDDQERYALATTLSADGRRLTTVGTDGLATVWDLAASARPLAHATVRIHPTEVAAAAVSPDGDTIAALGAQDRAMSLTDVSDPSRPLPLDVPEGPHTGHVVFGPDGRMLAVGDRPRIVLWDLTDRKRPARLADIPAPNLISTIAFSPDGGTVAIASAHANHAVDLWSVATPAAPVLLSSLRGHSDDVTAMAFSPDGRTLATGSADRTAALWDVTDAARPRRQAILNGSAEQLISVAFAPDGRTLATGGWDAVVTLWDVTERSGPIRVATLRRAGLRSDFLSFHQDGHTLVTAGARSSSTRAIRWDYSPLNALRSDPAGHACAVTGGGFSAAEWATLIPDAAYQPTCTG